MQRFDDTQPRNNDDVLNTYHQYLYDDDHPLQFHIWENLHAGEYPATVASIIVRLKINFETLQRKTLRKNPNHSTKKAKLSELQMAVTFSLIIANYIVCSLPLVVVFIVVSWPQNENYFLDRKRAPIRYCAVFFAHFHSAINPFIYAYRIKTVRDTLKTVLRIKKSAASSTEMNAAE